MKTVQSLNNCWKAMIIALVLGVFQRYASAQCNVGVVALYHTATTSASKCGISVGTSPYFYLQEQEVITQTGSASIDDTWANDGENLDSITASINTTSTTTYNSVDCSFQNTQSGNISFQEYAVFSEYGPPGGPPENLNWSATLDPTTDLWIETDGGEAQGEADNLMTGAYASGIDCSPSVVTSQSPIMTSSTTSCTGIFDSDGLWSTKLTDTTTLSIPYDDSMLQNKVAQTIPSYPSGWITNLQNVPFGSASFSFSNDNHTTASGQKMEYKFHLIGGTKGTSYRVYWNEVTTYPNNSPAQSINPKHYDITSNGDPINGKDGQVEHVNVPMTPETITVDNVYVTNSPSGPPGS